MFEQVVLSQIQQRFDLRASRLVTLRTAGIGESALQQRIGPWSRPDVILSYRSMPPENQIKLRFPPGFPEQQMEAVAGELADRIGESVFATDGLAGTSTDLPSSTLGLLKEHGQTVAAAEWGCGGRLCSLLHDGADAGQVFGPGHVWGPLDRPAAVLADVEPVSEAAARALAEGILRQSGASFGLGLTVASQPGAQDAVPRPGSAHMALAWDGTTLHRPVQLAGDRSLIRTLAAAAAVDFLRRHLLSR